MSRITRKEYEEYLNEVGEEMSDDDLIDRYGYLPYRLLRKGKLGQAIRKHDPIAFNVGFNAYKANKEILS